PHPSGEGRGPLAIEVALEAVPDRLVQENARPAGPEHDGHLSRGRVHRGELERRLARRLGGEPAPPALFQEKVEGHAAAAAVRADLPLATVLRDRRDAQAGERADVADRPARG